MSSITGKRLQDVAVVIPHKDDELRLTRCLAVLRGQCLDQGVEIVVVDNGSSDVSSVERTAYKFGAHFIHTAKGGSYHARNMGITATKSAEAFIFTDSDCIPCQTFVASYVNWLRRTPAHLLAAGPIEIVPKEAGKEGPWELLDMVTGLPQRVNVSRHGAAMTANLCVRRDAFSRFGLFDSSAYSGGDIDFTKRVSSATGGIAWIEEAVVSHPARHTRSEHLSKARRVADGVARYAQTRSRFQRYVCVARYATPPVRTIGALLRQATPLGVRLRALMGLIEVRLQCIERILNYPR